MRLLVAALAVCIACSNDSGNTFDGGVDGGNGFDGATSFMLRVDPAMDSETVTIGVQSKSVQFHAYRRDSATAPEVDVTSMVAWSISDVHIAMSSPTPECSLICSSEASRTSRLRSPA